MVARTPCTLVIVSWSPWKKMAGGWDGCVTKDSRPFLNTEPMASPKETKVMKKSGGRDPGGNL